MKYLLFIALLFEVSGFAQTEWPAGEGICRGRWSFERYPAKPHKNHGLESEICEQNKSECGSEIVKVYDTCKHESHGWGPWSEVYYLDSARQTVMWHHAYIDADRDMRQECRSRMERREIESGPNVPNKPHPKVNVIDYGNSHYKQLGKHCTRRDIFKKCQAWKYESEYTCFAKWQLRDYASKQSSACKPIGEKEVGKHCCHSQVYKTKRTTHVGPAQPTISDPMGAKIDSEGIANTSDHHKKGGRVVGTEQCRTGDELFVKDREQSQTKFNYLKGIYLEVKPVVEKDPNSDTPMKTEYSAILQTFEVMFQHHWDWLDKDQQQWILDQVTHVEANFPDLRPNPVIETED